MADCVGTTSKKSLLHISCLFLRKAAVRVARFVLVQNTKTGKNIPNYHELYQMSIKYKKDRKMDQVSIKYANIFHCKTLQNLPKFGFLV
jgi:hypothetical protein